MRPNQDEIIKMAKMLNSFNLKNIFLFNQKQVNYKSYAAGLYPIFNPKTDGVDDECVNTCASIALSWAQESNRNRTFLDLNFMLEGLNSSVRGGIIPPPPPPNDDD